MPKNRYIYPLEDMVWRKNCIAKQCPHCKKCFSVRFTSARQNNKTFCSTACFDSFYGDKPMRECTKCSEIKSKDCFPVAKHTRSKRQSWCRECTIRKSKERYKYLTENAEKFPEKFMKKCAVEGCKNKATLSHPRCGVHMYKDKNITDANPYKDQKHKFADRVIDYPDSPTGKAYVGIAKKPLMPAADSGHGFQGVLLQNDDRSLVQCHGCGEWRRELCAHVKSCCKMNVAQYKEKYGLGRGTGLVSDARSLEKTNKLLASAKHFPIGNSLAPRVQYKRRFPTTMEFMNDRGTCPLQVKHKIIEFIITNKELPRHCNRGSRIAQLLTRRFGSFSKGMVHHGLPYPKASLGGDFRRAKFVFPSGEIFESDTRDPSEREVFFQKMINECPMLSSPIL